LRGSKYIIVAALHHRLIALNAKWKWMSFAHTKELAFGLRNQTVVTQKTLMVQPNLTTLFKRRR
jgi:hypothetical protein